MENNYPKVLLLGNGINRAFSSSGVSNDDFLKKISTDEFKDFKRENIPFPLEVVIRTNDGVDESVKNHSKEMYGSVNNDEQRRILRGILSMGFDHILTTNYSYELEMASLSDKKTLSDNMLKNMIEHTSEVSRAESMYLLHTYNSVEYDGHKNKIWHIHGEARKPDSMIIGHYYYGNLLFKYKELSDNRKDQYQRYQRSNTSIPIKSWLDAFILGDVYILGFGFDFAEMDLWWLINRKKREKAEHGKVYFYEPHDDTDIKIKLLNVYGVETRNLNITKCGKDEYSDFYIKAMNDIKRNLNL